jgi:hypothetical protein
MKSSLSILIFLGLTLLGQSQIATVEGRASVYRDQPFKIFEQINHLTGQEKLIVHGRIDEGGNFSFELPLTETKGLRMQVGGLEANLFVQPDKHYQVTLPRISKKAGRKLNDNQVAFQFGKETSEPNINSILANLDREVQDFSLDQAVDLSYRDAAKAVTFRGRKPERGKTAPKPIEKPDTLINVSKEMLAKIDAFGRRMEITNAVAMEDPFVKGYLDYCIAGLQLQAGKKKWEVYYKYLHESEVFRDNPEYARFANQFYGGLFIDAFSSGDYRYSKAINSLKDPHELMVQLGTDLYLDDPNIAQVAMLVNLQEVYFKRGWNRQAIETILQIAAQDPEFKDFNQDFEFVAEHIGSGLKGSKVPNFKMLDQNSQFFHRGDLGQKYLYIGFFTSWSSESYKEMQLLHKYRIKYGRDIEFISISMDDKFEDFTDFVVENSGLDWIFLYGPSYDALRDVFSIHTVPTYILLAPDGTIMYDYTRKPSEGINLEFDKLQRKTNRPDKIKVWDD